MATVNLNVSENLDAFGRKRVSELTTLIDVKQLADDQPLLIDKVTNGTATAAYQSGESSTRLTTSADGDYAIAQTFQRFNYQSGKSHLIEMTMTGFDPETNITKRIGYFSSSFVAPYTAGLDGLFMESSGGVVSINIYKGGTLIEQTPQSSWSLDHLDGGDDASNPSGIDADWSKDQIFIADLQWLGVGIVRWYLNIDGVFYQFHQSNHANNLVGVYMQSPNQPLRWEIRQTGAGSGDFDYICAAVSSEGAQNEVGTIRSATLGSDVVRNASAGTLYALLGIRLKTDYAGSTIDVLNLDLLATSNDNFQWQLLRNPTVANTFTYTGVTDDAVEVATGASNNTVTGGQLLASGHANQDTVISREVKNAIRLGVGINGTPDEFVLCTGPMTGSTNLDISGSIDWRNQI